MDDFIKHLNGFAGAYERIPDLILLCFASIQKYHWFLARSCMYLILGFGPLSVCYSAFRAKNNRVFTLVGGFAVVFFALTLTSVKTYNVSDLPGSGGPGKLSMSQGSYWAWKFLGGIATFLSPVDTNVSGILGSPKNQDQLISGAYAIANQEYMKGLKVQPLKELYSDYVSQCGAMPAWVANNSARENYQDGIQPITKDKNMWSYVGLNGGGGLGMDSSRINKIQNQELLNTVVDKAVDNPLYLMQLGTMSAFPLLVGTTANSIVKSKVERAEFLKYYQRVAPKYPAFKGGAVGYKIASVREIMRTIDQNAEAGSDVYNGVLTPNNISSAAGMSYADYGLENGALTNPAQTAADSGDLTDTLFYAGDCYQLYVITNMAFSSYFQALAALYPDRYKMKSGKITAGEGTVNASVGLGDMMKMIDSEMDASENDINPQNSRADLHIGERIVIAGDQAWDKVSKTLSEFMLKYGVVGSLGLLAWVTTLLIFFLPIFALFAVLSMLESLITWLKLLVVCYFAMLIAQFVFKVGGSGLQWLGTVYQANLVGVSNATFNIATVYYSAYSLLLGSGLAIIFVFARLVILNDMFSINSVKTPEQVSGFAKIGMAMGSAAMALAGGKIAKSILQTKAAKGAAKDPSHDASSRRPQASSGAPRGTPRGTAEAIRSLHDKIGRSNSPSQGESNVTPRSVRNSPSDKSNFSK